MAGTTKVVILAAAIMATMVVLANARRYETTVITTNVPRLNQRSSEKWCRVLLRYNWPVNCEKYLMDRAAKGHRRGGYGSREEDVIMTPMNQGRELILQCCDDLKWMESNFGCMCKAMEAMVERMKEMPGQSMSQSLMDETLSLPMMCGTERRKCPMPSM